MNGCFCNLAILFAGVLMTRALYWAPDVCKLPLGDDPVWELRVPRGLIYDDISWL